MYIGRYSLQIACLTHFYTIYRCHKILYPQERKGDLKITPHILII